MAAVPIQHRKADPCTASSIVARGCDQRFVPSISNTLLQGSRTLCTSCLLLGQDELMRRQENQYLWWTKDEVQQWSLAAQKQAGYVLDNPFLGHCDETNPVDVVRVDADSGT